MREMWNGRLRTTVCKTVLASLCGTFSEKCGNGNYILFLGKMALCEGTGDGDLLTYEADEALLASGSFGMTVKYPQIFCLQ